MDLQKMLLEGITEKVLGEITSKVGVSGTAAESAIKAALPMIMGGLSKNADSTEGKKSINTALDAHSEDEVLDEGVGSKILSHILGSNEKKVESAVAEKAGISTDQAQSITKLIAPYIMGKLGGAKKSGLNIGDLLQGETKTKSMLTMFLDKDGDGSITDDLLSMGGDFLKKKFL